MADSSTAITGTEVRDDGDGPTLAAHRQSIVVIGGPDRGLRREIRTARVTIGTAPDNRLVLTDPTVSRRHAEIAHAGGQYVIRDLGSTNGTRVNGVKVAEAELPPRARIRVGDTELRFEPKRKWERIKPIDETELEGMRGASTAMRTIFDAVRKIAETDLYVLVTGETGTGKELVARAIHRSSPRAGGPFEIVDCSVLGALGHSELFGHERGAFTDAVRSHAGAFERASGGTVFIDEVGELPLELQPALLRVLQERTVKRIGAQETIEVDVRVVAATHRPLWDMIAEGTFREDLYHRLAEVMIAVPPLRDRVDDVPMLVGAFLEEAAIAPLGIAPPREDALRWLAAQPWPGNVRQLRNLVRRAVALSGTGELDREALEAAAMAASASTGEDAADGALSELVVEGTLADVRDHWNAKLEREYLLRLLNRFDGDVDRAAREADIHRKSLLRLLRRHGIALERPP